MSVVQEQRNTLKKRFGRQAVVIVNDDLYSASLLEPTSRNNRLFPVKEDACERLNNTMQSHIDGNAQIFQTMIYKDKDRGPLIKRFYNGMIERPEFKALPKVFQELERQQASKLGPTSRFSIEKLYDGFINHIDVDAKTKNEHYDEYSEASEYFIQYLCEMLRRSKKKYRKEYRKVVNNFETLKKAYDNLNKDKSGGDRYFIRVDRKIAGLTANDLYLQDASKIQRNSSKSVYFEMFRRVQAGGNSFVPNELATPITTSDEDLASDTIWKPEKNRVVQGDSRSVQFLMKNISDVFTKLIKLVDPNFCGWSNQETKNIVIENFMREFQGKYLFDSFDATDYDASTDPENFRLGIHIMYEACRRIGLKPDDLYREDDCIRHYLYDATLTPWGAYTRAGSTPSGSNFTGPNGTITNMLRCYVQTARLFKLSYEQFNRVLFDYADRDIPLWFVVGDDAVSLRDMLSTAESIAKENDLDGFKQGDLLKLVLSKNYIHFLQNGYYLDENTHEYMGGYYPVSRLMEHSLFQEEAAQYTSEEVSTQAVDQNIFNCRYNPLQEYAVEFLMEGDPKFRLGSIHGVMNLFKAAAGDRTVAEFLGREWDPQYQSMTWEQFGDLFAPTAEMIERLGRKLYPNEIHA